MTDHKATMITMQEWFLRESHKHDIIIASTYVTQVYMGWTIATIFCVYMHVCVCACVCVCICLSWPIATKVFIGKLPASG